MTATQQDDFTVMVGRLNKLSVERHFDAYADIDWDSPDFAIDPDDIRFELPGIDPLRHSDWYAAQSPAERARIGCYRWAACMKTGWHFENLLQRGLLRQAFEHGNGKPEFRYLHHEIIEESQHTLMFQEFVNRSGLPVRGMPWGLRRLAESFVLPISRVFPTLFFLFVLGGEDPVDHLQRRVLSDSDQKLHPLVERIMRIHTTEEARHLSFARHYLHRTVPQLGFFRRLHLALIAPVVLGIMARLMLQPSGDMVREFAIPRDVVRSANNSKAGRQLLKDSVAKTRKLFVELGLITPLSKTLWKAAGLWDDKLNRTKVLIIGTGFAGLGMAIRLKQAGINEFVVLERAGEVGGTWRDNTYPGAACDVPSNLYSFSFAPNPDWSRSFSPQAEIQEYLRRTATDFAVRPHIRFDHEVRAARWDEAAQRWRVQTNAGDFEAEVLVSATGALSDPSIPSVPGLDRFEGTVFHSAQWRHDHDLTGERVAVVGTGASAIQFVPQIQPQVGRLTVFQRTPPWIMPRWDRPFRPAERFAFRHLPLVQRLARAGIYWGREQMVAGFVKAPNLMRIAERVARRHLERSVPDPLLRAKLTPGYRIGCKRILISNDYLPSLAQPNVDLVAAGLSEIRERSVVAADGTEHQVDTIIFGTGFHVTDIPVADRIIGPGGVTLKDRWASGMKAYKGTAVAGFPNLFLLVGPNTGLGHSSQVFMIESQIAYVLDAVRHLQRTGDVVAVREDSEAAWDAGVQRAMSRTVWTTGGCASWYLDDSGRNTTLWPGATWRFRHHTARFDPSAYRVLERVPTPESLSVG